MWYRDDKRKKKQAKIKGSRELSFPGDWVFYQCWPKKYFLKNKMGKGGPDRFKFKTQLRAYASITSHTTAIKERKKERNRHTDRSIKMFLAPRENRQSAWQQRKRRRRPLQPIKQPHLVRRVNYFSSIVHPAWKFLSRNANFLISSNSLVVIFDKLAYPPNDEAFTDTYQRVFN